MIKRNGIHFYILKIFKLQNFKIMAKYGEKAQEKVAETMHEMKEGKLKTGTGKKVIDKKQAVAIGLSEAKKEGGKVPKKKSNTSLF